MQATPAKASPRPPVLSGTINDALGRPIAGARVRVQAAGRVIARTHTDSTGAFQFKTIAPGTYTISVNKQGFKPTVEIIVVSAGKQPRADGARDGGDGAADAQGDHRTAEQGAQRFGAGDRCDGVSVRSGGDSQTARGTKHQPCASAAAGAGREPGRIRARAGADSHPRRKRRRYPVPDQRHLHAGGGDELRRNFQPALRA